MSEVLSSHAERPNEVLDRVLARMRELYAQSAGEETDQERISKGMSSQIIGETTQKALLALIDEETRRLTALSSAERWDSARLSQETLDMKTRVTADVFKEHWFESTLSTVNHPIHAATYGISMFRYDLRLLTANNPTSEDFKKFGWVMFDLNGLRSFKDCTSHPETTRFLQGIVKILVDPNGPTNLRMKDMGISVIPMATGGDEFVLYLRGNQPLTQEIIDDIIASYQQEVSSSAELRAFLDFDDEGVLMKFGMPSRERRREYDQAEPDEQVRQLREIRDMLPDGFIPSMAGGGALLDEGILRAVERDDHDLQGEDQTFLTLRETIVQSTIDIAETRQKTNKERDLRRLEIEDPKRHAFRYRNAENRRLLDENRKLTVELERLQTVIGATRGDIGTLMDGEGI